MKKVGLFFDRGYVDAQWCFTELARQLTAAGYLVDIYHISNPYNPPPMFFDDRIRIFGFPRSGWQKLEFFGRILRARDRRYCAVIGTPPEGARLACRVARRQRIPFIYLADEVLDPDVRFHQMDDWEKARKRDGAVNRMATATIALSEDRYKRQREINALGEEHRYFVIPNAPSGEPERVKSNFFRDMLGLSENLPVVLFIGTLDWKLARKLYDQPETAGAGKYHLVFHGRSKGLMGSETDRHPFIRLSHTPLPSYLLHYAVCSADAGLVLYDRDVPQERLNGMTGGKLPTYLRSGLPVIAGNLEGLKQVEQDGIGAYWDGRSELDPVVSQVIANRSGFQGRIMEYYMKNLEYSSNFGLFRKFLDDNT